MRRKRLLRRLSISYLWITIAAVVLGGLYGARLMRDFHLKRTEEDLEACARLCTKQVLQLLEQGSHDAIDALCKELG